jgi:hypothetical protein
VIIRVRYVDGVGKRLFVMQENSRSPSSTLVMVKPLVLYRLIKAFASKCSVLLLRLLIGATAHNLIHSKVVSKYGLRKVLCNDGCRDWYSLLVWDCSVLFLGSREAHMAMLGKLRSELDGQ